MVDFPILYKKTSTGAIQYWNIQATSQIGQMNENEFAPNWGLIVTRFGQVGGKEQVTNDTIVNGKNPGKKNSTTAVEQAMAEAKAKWEKQKKKGYVESVEAAQNDETDDLIEGGILPMLAHSFSKSADKIKYPAAAQPKLDGIRCIAIVKDGACTLWSRTRKPITSVPHIIEEIEAVFGHKDIVLDGELYNHAFKSDFEKIVSLVRQEDPGEGFELVQYHIYDQVSNDYFEDRYDKLTEMMEMQETVYITLVPTVEVENEEHVMARFDQAIAMGFEGVMIRNSKSPYVNKRSTDLLKVKEFQDDEFDIIGIEEGRGKLAGHAIFVCMNEAGSTFLAKMKGETSRLKKYFEDHSLWIGKKLTVQYQGLTGREKVPRFPVGIAIRDYE